MAAGDSASAPHPHRRLVGGGHLTHDVPRGITGAELAFRAFDQAWLFGAELIYGNPAEALSAAAASRIVTLGPSEAAYTPAARPAGPAPTTATSYRRLGVPALEALVGAGVVYGAAVAEAHALAGQRVFVIGGGNSAGQAAMHLARYAERVTILIRSDSLSRSMSDYLIREIDAARNVNVRPFIDVVVVAVTVGWNGWISGIAVRARHKPWQQLRFSF